MQTAAENAEIRLLHCSYVHDVRELCDQLAMCIVIEKQGSQKTISVSWKWILHDGHFLLE